MVVGFSIKYWEVSDLDKYSRKCSDKIINLFINIVRSRGVYFYKLEELIGM